MSDAQAAAVEIQESLASVMADLQALQRDGLPEQLQDAVQSLLMSFAKEADTAEQRRAVNQLIQGLDIRITLDSATQTVGMAVGDGPPVWERVNPNLDRAALLQGMAGAIGEELELDEEAVLMLRELAKQQGNDVVDISEGVAAMIGIEAASGPFLIDTQSLRRV